MGSPASATAERLKDVNNDKTPEAVNKFLRPLMDDDFVETSSVGSTKRKKTMDELCASRYTAPGLSQSHALGHSQEVRRLGTEFISTIIVEKEKKKISKDAYTKLLLINESFMDIMEVMIVENSILEGRLLEARVSEEAANIHRRVIIDRELAREKKQKEVPTTVSASDAMETDEAHTMESRPTRVPVKDRIEKRTDTERRVTIDVHTDVHNHRCANV